MPALLVILIIVVITAFFAWNMRTRPCEKCGSKAEYQDGYGTHCEDCGHRKSKW